MKRKIIKIDEDKCDGCGLCAKACAEGAIKIIDGKARLVSETYCDGLGACIGECPAGALTIEEREAGRFDEEAVKAHIREEKTGKARGLHGHQGCPGSRMMNFERAENENSAANGYSPSRLSQWPIQLHLVSPEAPYYKNADVILSADCVAYALAVFHENHLKGKSLAIACPKLDDGKDVYAEKIVSLIDDARINTLTVMIMEVPCCSGLLALAHMALKKSKRKVPLKCVTVSLRGEILSDKWL